MSLLTADSPVLNLCLEMNHWVSDPKRQKRDIGTDYRGLQLTAINCFRLAKIHSLSRACNPRHRDLPCA